MAVVCAASIAIHGVTGIAMRRAWPLYLLGVWCVWVLFRSSAWGAWTNPQIVTDTWAIWPDLRPHGGMAPGRAGLWEIRTLSFVLAGWYASQRFMRSDRVTVLLRTLVGSAYAVVLVGLLQHLLQPSEILWFYTPIDWSRVVPLAGPFVNPNQAGAYVGLAAVLSAIHTSTQRTRTAQLICGMLTLPLIAYVILIGARGAVVAILGSLCAWVIFLAIEGVSARRRALFTLGLTALILLGSAALLYLDSPLDRWIQDGTLRDKIDIWRAARHVPPHAGIFGLGPRGFQDAFAILGLNSSHVWIEDPESGPLQLATEHGPLIALLIAGVFAWVVYAVQAARSHRRAPLYAGLSAVAVYVGLETITGMGLHASAYLLGVGAWFGVAIGRVGAGTRAPAGARHQLPAWGLLLLSIAVLAQSATAVQVSLDDSRVPLAQELKDHGLHAPEVMKRATQHAKATPGRAALLEQMALIYSAQDNHSKAVDMARALGRAAPNYASAQRNALRVTVLADKADEACRLFQTYRERFGGLPTHELILWHERGTFNPACFRSEEEQLLVALAFVQFGKSDLADSMILSLVAEPKEAATPTLIEAVRTSLRMDAPLLATPWVEELGTRDDLERPHYAALHAWARTLKDKGWRYRVAQNAQRAFPDDPEFNTLRLEAYVSLPLPDNVSGWHDEILTQVEDAQELTRGHPKLYRRVNLVAADAAWRANHTDAALKAYQDLEHTTLSSQDRILVHYRLGELSRANDDYVRAQKYYRQVLEDAPKHKEATEALKAIGD